MQVTWSRLLLILRLATPLVSAIQFTNVTTVAPIPENPVIIPPIDNGIYPQPGTITRNSVATSSLDNSIHTQSEAAPIPEIPIVTLSLDNATVPQPAVMKLLNSTTLSVAPSDPTATQSPSDGDLMQTVAIDVPTTTTSVTITSSESAASQSVSDSDLTQIVTTDLPIPTTSVIPPSSDPTTTGFVADVDNDFDPVPTTSSALSVVSDYIAPTPTPGSIAILNGIPIRVLSNNIQQTDSVHADAAEDTFDIYQPWNTSYPGPIHDDDWNKYLKIWDPIWWSMKLDSLRQTSCLCSNEDYLINPQAQIAAYMEVEYYSHQSSTVSALTWSCGPAPSSMTLGERKTSAKGKAEHCWTAAGGEFAGDHSFEKLDDKYFCDEEEILCVRPWRAGHRAFKYHNHKRNYDRAGVHTWSEIQPVVRDVCAPICQDKFRMGFNDYAPHNPSIITTFYPAKPIDLSIIGD